jgi:hypothetical protein
MEAFQAFLPIVCFDLDTEKEVRATWKRLKEKFDQIDMSPTAGGNRILPEVDEEELITNQVKKDNAILRGQGEDSMESIEEPPITPHDPLIDEPAEFEIDDEYKRQSTFSAEDWDLISTVNKIRKKGGILKSEG